jgi:hypothetical protein
MVKGVESEKIHDQEDGIYVVIVKYMKGGKSQVVELTLIKRIERRTLLVFYRKLN